MVGSVNRVKVSRVVMQEAESSSHLSQVSGSMVTTRSGFDTNPTMPALAEETNAQGAALPEAAEGGVVSEVNGGQLLETEGETPFFSHLERRPPFFSHLERVPSPCVPIHRLGGRRGSRAAGAFY